MFDRISAYHKRLQDTKTTTTTSCYLFNSPYLQFSPVNWCQIRQKYTYTDCHYLPRHYFDFHLSLNSLISYRPVTRRDDLPFKPA